MWPILALRRELKREEPGGRRRNQPSPGPGPGLMSTPAPESAPVQVDRKLLISAMVLMSEYALLFLSAVIILLVVCLRSTARLRTRLVYFYVITIIISLGTLTNLSRIGR